jgi:hypothetical protein
MARFARFALLAIILLVAAFLPATAGATCAGDTCCAPGGPCTKVDPTAKWQEYGEDWRFELGGGLNGGLVGGEDGTRWARGGTVEVGFHIVNRFLTGGVDHDDIALGAWCAPVACAGIWADTMAPSVVWGNDWGVDLRVDLQKGMRGTGGDKTTAELVVDPVARASRRSSWRTASLLGTLVPEVGWRPVNGAVRIGWQAYRIDYRFNLFALKWDVATVGPVFAANEQTRWSVMSTLRVSLLVGNGYW